jgi:hypothetical protein
MKTMAKFHDVEQNTEEWFQLRCGKITGSAVSDIMVNCKKLEDCNKPKWGEGAKKYALKLALERITGKYIPSSYSNASMEKGHEMEPIARDLYEKETFNVVTNGGFYDNEDNNCACSPDGVFGSGRLEIKNEAYHLFFMTKKMDRAATNKRWQIPFNLKYSDGEWIDYAGYCESYPEDKQLFIKPFTLDDCVDDFKMLDARIEYFEMLIEYNIKIING